jgi:peptidoglycan hydrolase-like protein with peptidoglycan-binding domain
MCPRAAIRLAVALAMSLAAVGPTYARAPGADAGNAAEHGDRDAILRVQVMLDRAAFSVGEIDGRSGDNTVRALRAFQRAPGLAEGQHVQRGDVIGFVGTTGNAALDAPHLHFAIFKLEPAPRWWHGTALDPHPLLVPAR